MSETRDYKFDTVKGIAIILVVLGHAHCYEPISRFFHLFHVPIFFMIAGWFYRFGSEGFVVKKISRLYLPLVFWSMVCMALHNVMMRLNIYTDNPVLLECIQGRFIGLQSYYSRADILSKVVPVLRLLWIEQCLGAVWFLRVLFVALLAYWFCDLLLHKITSRNSCVLLAQTVFSFACLIMARYFCPKIVLAVIVRMGGIQILTAYALIHLGVLLRRLDAWNDRFERNEWCVLGGSFVVLFVLSCFGEVSIALNRIPTVLFLLSGSVAGWCFLLSLSAKLSQVACMREVLGYVGRHTMPILLFHLLAFKIVSAIGVCLKGEPLCLVAAFPVRYEGWWCVAYSVVGVMVPLSCNAIWWWAYQNVKERVCHG